jgi:hypothetical protein
MNGNLEAFDAIGRIGRSNTFFRVTGQHNIQYDL